MNTDAILDVFCCPACRGDLTRDEGVCRCSSCRGEYPVVDGIPDLYVEHDDQLANKISELNLAFYDKAADTHENDYRSVRSKVLKRLLRRAVAKEAFGNYSRNRIREIVSHYRKTDGLFLDVGCGTGNVLEAASKVWDRTVGTDISQNMLLKAHGRGLNTARANNYKTPFRDGSIDMISAFSVMHHMANLGAFCGEMSRICRPGGLFYTDYDPNPIATAITRESFVYRKLAGMLRRVVKRDFCKAYSSTLSEANLVDYHTVRTESFSIENLRRLFRKCGFSVERMHFHSDCFSVFGSRLFNTRLEQKTRQIIKHLMDRRRSVTECGEYVLFILKRRKEA